jgi:hypothetical protein
VGKEQRALAPHYMYQAQQPAIVKATYVKSRRLYMVFRSPIKPTMLTANSLMPGKSPPMTFTTYYKEK